MTTLKSVLTRQAAIPANLEKSIPGIPQISSIMSQFALALPLDPVIPELPAMEMMGAPLATGITGVIKGGEDALPGGIPKMSEGIQAFTIGGYRPVATEEKKNNAQVRKVQGSGYRSI